MNSGNTVRLELLSRDNYDTWKLQIRAVLVRNNVWGYVSGAIPQPSPIRGPNGVVENAEERECRKEQDEKALADIILSVMPSELAQIKYCATSRESWQNLSNTYESKGPARKASLLKQLILNKMRAGDDVRDHIRKFEDVVDRLNAMNIVIHEDPLSVMLLYSLPSSFENFRIAIEPRDELPSLERLRVTIVEESEAKKRDVPEEVPDAMVVSRIYRRTEPPESTTTRSSGDLNAISSGTKQRSVGVMKKALSVKRKSSLLPVATKGIGGAYGFQQPTTAATESLWCLDSGCPAHLCKDPTRLTNKKDSAKKYLYHGYGNGELVFINNYP